MSSPTITSPVTLTNRVWQTGEDLVSRTSATLTLTCTDAWILTSTQPWIRLGQTSGTGNASVVISIAPDVAFPQESAGFISRVRQTVGTFQYTATLTLTDTVGTATCSVQYLVGWGDGLGISSATQPDAPVISANGTTVTLSSDINAPIWYTTDGSEPAPEVPCFFSPQSTLYTGPFVVSVGAVVQAVAVTNTGWSPIASSINGGDYLLQEDGSSLFLLETSASFAIILEV